MEATIITTARELSDAGYGGGRDDATLEEQLASALAGMRRHALDCDTDDFYENREIGMLDRRPLVLVGIALAGSTCLWAMELGIEDGHDGMVRATVHHLKDQNGRPVSVPEVSRETKKRLMQEIEERIDWLFWEENGDRLGEVRGRHDHILAEQLFPEEA